MRNKVLKEAPLVKLAVSLMAGVIVGDNVSLSDFQPLWLVLVGMVGLALLLWRSALWQSVAIGLSFVVLGVLLTAWQEHDLRVTWPEGEVCYEAVVLSEPVEKPKTMAVDVIIAANGWKLKCYLSKDDRSRALRIGDGLRIQSHIRELSDWHVGTLDYRRYLEVHGFSGTTFVAAHHWQKARFPLVQMSRIERTKLFFLKLRSRLLARLKSHDAASQDAYAVVAAMVLGDKSALSRDLKDVYSVTGASHVLALSGLHLSIIYMLLSLLNVGRRWQSVSQLLMVLGIWAFVFLVGLPVSVVRSAMMLTAYGLLSLGHRDKMSVNTLAFVAIILLAVSPLSLFDVGFQLSFMAVLSIVTVLPLLDGLWSEKYLQEHRIVHWAWSMAAVSCAAQMGVAPLIAYYFGRFSCYFLLTNFIVVPMTTLILYLSLVVLLFPGLVYLLLYIAGSLNWILSVIADWPRASINGLHPTLLQVVMTYVVITAVWLLWVRVRR